LLFHFRGPLSRNLAGFDSQVPAEFTFGPNGFSSGSNGEDRAEIDFFVPQTDAAAVGDHAWIVYQAIFWRDSYIAIVDH
jgi:hypothetical protein